jgi:hypothetical protein
MRELDWEEILREAWDSALETEFKAGAIVGREVLGSVLDNFVETGDDARKAASDHLKDFLTSHRPVPIAGDDESALIFLAAGIAAVVKEILSKDVDPSMTYSETFGFLYSVTSLAYRLGYHRGSGG